MKVTISLELAQAIVDYLSLRPYKEVAGLIEALLAAKPTGGNDGVL